MNADVDNDKNVPGLKAKSWLASLLHTYVQPVEMVIMMTVMNKRTNNVVENLVWPC